MTRRITTDRRLTLSASPREVWDRLGDVSAYRTWWPWLHRFDARALEPGEVWRCEVSPPLPYVVRFSMTIEETVVESLVVATIDGDIRGTARLTVGPRPVAAATAAPASAPVPAPDRAVGTELRLAAELSPVSTLLRAVTWGAGPVARFGHDWVIETGARQFAERAFRTPRPEPARPLDGDAEGATVLERKISRGRMRTF